METIRLAEALERMEKAKEPFTLRFVTYDVSRKTGGRVVEWEDCRLAAKCAGHPYRYATRNLLVGASSQRRKVHIWLLLALNGVKIVL
ncbi:MAG: hypothetical protein EOO63_14850 [Hymenobacter sp.]|nr:MAG: hypothetical protein EOO63_14850 [Hymenobacter sp.]